VGAGQDGLEVWGLRGDHVERLGQIAVSGGDAEPDLARQRAQLQAVAQPAKHEHDLGVHRAGPLLRAGSGGCPYGSGQAAGAGWGWGW
jgi:hypothetical protein